MKPKKNSTSSKKTKVFKTVKPGVEISYLTSKQMNTEPASYFSPQLPRTLLEDNLNDWLKQMDYAFKILCLVGIYFLGHFMVTFPMPSWYGILNICIGIGALIAGWKYFFENKNAILPEVKAFLEKYTTPPRK